MPYGEAALAFADTFVDGALRRNPFAASYMGFSEYAALVPDVSAEARSAWRARLVETVAGCDRVPAAGADAVLVDVVRDSAGRELAELDAAVDEWTVTPMPSSGLSLLLLLAALTELRDAAAAQAYLERLRGCARDLDQCAQRLRDAAAAGRVAVAPLVAAAVEQHRRYLASPQDDPLLAVAPPDGWGSAGTWRSEVEQVVRAEIRPAVGRVLDTLLALLPVARPDDRPGLLHVPGGTAAYGCAVRAGTTLAADPEELHAVGLSTLDTVVEAMTGLGGRLYGLRTLDEVLERMRAAPTGGERLLDRCTAAVRRAERHVEALFGPPYPPPCQVRAMPEHLAASGSPPMYAPPARDGSHDGAYLVNLVAPGPASGWALESVCFHETVPGHHAQLARLQQTDLPRVLTAFEVSAHAEGWGLYAEQLADELGLYSDDEQRLGRLVMTAWRAVRLVVDTGLHARGWTREQAVRFCLQHTALPEGFVRAEVDRYIGWPGQALSYLVGLREILRLRDEAQRRLGAAFTLPAFHSAVLDHGNVPLPVLARVVDRWIADVLGPD